MKQQKKNAPKMNALFLRTKIFREKNTKYTDTSTYIRMNEMKVIHTNAVDVSELKSFFNIYFLVTEKKKNKKKK